RMGTFKLSGMYETKPLENAGGDDFYNCVLAGVYYGPVEELHKDCREAEIFLGSTAHKNSAARALDMDLLLYENTVMEEENLILPHPRLHLRKFVLVPLAEVWDKSLPGLDSTPAQLLEVCPDDSRIKRVFEMPERGCFWEVSS
ncbi:MAG: 2-amino-4-hydroxy-6-hydroxymethyldihydropteridine diphosphokinase, partial [Candidatus Aegiribacteria sp.]|nr:2-amino-4-hydroxy-6-hydroxymethyldihydropteridine diphosphokinase [Candidatus Aegiribacteria sp.]